LDDLIEQIDTDEMVEKLTDCYKLLLNDIDTHKIIVYDKMIIANMENINKRIIKPIIINILCAPFDIFEIFMNLNINIDDQQDKLMKFMELSTNNIILLDCISAFHNLIEMHVDEDAFINKKTYGNNGSLVPSHLISMWEIIKYIHSIFKELYITLKTLDTQKYSSYKKKYKSFVDSDSDSDIDNLPDYDIFNMMESTSYHKQNIKKPRFIPPPYDDFNEFDMEITNNDKNMYVDTTKLSETDKNSLLENINISWGYNDYMKLLPKVQYKPLVITK
jgi:hypothetical protein